jgi:hypothetical protein
MRTLPLRNVARLGSPPALKRIYRSRLLAGSARVHIDFHADRHFDDFRCFPGHLVLLVKADELRPADKLIAYEKFASEIFYPEPFVLCCSAKGNHTFVRPGVKTKTDRQGSSRQSGCCPRFGFLDKRLCESRGSARSLNKSGLLTHAAVFFQHPYRR